MGRAPAVRLWGVTPEKGREEKKRVSEIDVSPGAKVREVIDQFEKLVAM